MKHLKATLLLLLLAWCSLAITAQEAESRVSGKVTDAMGALIGVSVMEKGTNNGTVTDVNGNFTIDKVRSGATLQFSYVGYKPVDIKVGNQKRINVTMSEEAQSLDEVTVVAVGYGDVKRRDLTGAIGSASVADLKKVPATNVLENLGGRIAGVNVASTDGGLGDNFNIVIRGAGSLTGSTAPLYVIDGFPQETSTIGALNVNDIESIDVLKDASATAIYGARGANGVVIITTKQGKEGKPTISYNGSLTVSSVRNKPEMMDGYDFVRLQREIITDDATFESNYLTELYPTIDDYKNAQSYDWQDYIYRTAVSNSHHVAMAGSQKDLNYNTSLSYDNQEGVIINSGLKRYQGRINLKQKVNDKLCVDVNANYASTVQDGPTASTSTSSMSTAYMYSVWAFRPVSPTGSDLLNQLYDEGVNMTEDYRFNPVLSAKNEYRHKTTNNLQANAGIDYTIAKGLNLKIKGGYSSRDYTNEEFNGLNTRTGNSHPSNTLSKGINAYYYQRTDKNYLNENTLTYQYKKRKQNLNALLGLSFQKSSQYIHSITTNHITSEAFGMAGLDKGDDPIVYNSKGDNSLMSYFGRINYNYASLYYLTVTMRADGSSKFAKQNRWGYFPSGSVAWAFSREAFLNDIDWLSNGKLRLSYGQTGNNRIGNYEYMAHLVTDGKYYKYPWNGNFSTGYVLNQMGNEALKWETTEQTDLGLDLGFLNSRINLTLDYYIKTTRDLLLDADVAASSGFSSATLNVGKLRNKGFELTLETTNIRNRNFTWTSSFNIAFNQNKIIALNSDQTYMLSYINWDTKYKTTPAYISQVGKAAGQMYGFIYEGTYKYDDFDITTNAAGETIYTLKSDVPYYVANTQPGDPKYRDINNDGVINDEDKTTIGNGQPKHIGGFNNSFTWKNFDLNIFLQWSYGNDILNANRLRFENPAGKQNTNMYATYNDRWSTNNPTSDIPRARASGSEVYSSLYVEDGSYLKLKSLALGYNFDRKTLKPLHLSQARVYITAENIATLTGYSGSDPEVSTRNSVLTPGFDWSAYPRAFSMSFGLNVTF
jgi:TonB-linked SusC/RagA family outer membrane protein